MPHQQKPPIVRMYNVHKAYGKNQALRDISFEVQPGEVVFITGPTGAGKTTLLKLIYRGEEASQGNIVVDGINVSRIRKSQLPHLRRRIGIIFQDFKLIPGLTVFDNVALVLEASESHPKSIEKKVMRVLRVAEIEDKAKVFPMSLSGGEQQRVAVARAVVGVPRLILADEPTASLDPESAKHILKLLKYFHERGSTLVIATHNKEMMSHLQGREVSLVGGGLT